MTEAHLISNLKRAAKLAVIACSMAAVIILLRFYARPLFLRVPEASRWRGALAFLIALETAYVTVMVVCLTGIPLLLFLLKKGRKQGVRHPLAVRGLLLCISLFFGLGLSEMTVAVLRSQVRRPLTIATNEIPRDPPNDKLGRLPDPIEEVALPEKFAEVSSKDEVSIVVIGESSAAGFPFNYWFSMGDILTWKLKEAIPQKTFLLDVIAVSGDTLEAQHKKLAGLRRRPDVLIVYCGHNEFSSRFPWSRDLDHYVDSGERTAWQRFVQGLEQTSPVCGLIRESADKCRIAIPPPQNGNRSLVDAPAYTPTEYQSLLADFHRRLDAIVSYAQRIGAIPILIVPPANDSGFEPNRSFLPRETLRSERQSFASEFSEARRLEATNPDESLQRYRSLLGRYPGFAELHYRVARLLEHAGAWDEAYQHDVAARDHDGLPMRCLSVFQDAYHEVAGRRLCPLIDAQTLFRAIAPHKLLDDHLFQDGMHPSLRGMIALSQAVLGELHARRAFDWPETSPPPLIDPTLCATHFGLGPKEWAKLCGSGILFYSLTAPIRYDSSERLRRKDMFQKASEQLLSGRSPQALGLPNIGVPKPVPSVLAHDPNDVPAMELPTRSSR